jgi:glycosyltransferase involved in cell wall biosynthesis
MMPDRANHGRLSVLLVTYNHAKHVHRALESLFAQSIDSPIELVIADDGSSDGTVDIIKTFETRFPSFHFKYLDDTSHLGITRNYQRGFAACTEEYVAILEGDDYWVSPLKLKRQCDFLETHWECDLCSVNYFVYEEDRSRFAPRTAIGTGHRFIDARELIADNLVGNFSTCMYRKSALDALPEALFEVESYDWIVNICVARQSLIGFLETPMSVYRLHTRGVWTQKPHFDKLRCQLELIPAYDELTSHVFHAEFDLLASRLRDAIAESEIARSEPVPEPAPPAFEPATPAVPGWRDYVPPVLMSLGRALAPPELKRRISRMHQRGRGM